MNDKDRDRSGEGAGPSDDPGPYCRPLSLKHIILFLLVAMVGLADYSNAQPGRGLSVTIEANSFFSNNAQANFYQGIPQNSNTILRVLHSQQYGYPIWIDLTEQDLITSSISSYRQLQIEEYGDMSYRLAIHLGFGFRYDLGGGWGWLARFNYAKLNAFGQFLIQSGRNSPGLLTNQDAYVACPIVGEEKRIFLDFGVSRRVMLNTQWFMNMDLGVSVNNTKVVSNDIQVAGVTYNILDIWEGRYPDMGTVAYDYINQGGLGFGTFASLGFGILLPGYNTITFDYTLQYAQTNLENYTSYNFQHLLGVRFELGDFSFFD